MKMRIDSRTILYFILVIIAASGFLFTLVMPSPEGFYAFIAVIAFTGFCVSANIYDTKQAGKQLVCPTGSDCNAVVNSRYSKFFGVSLEKWGLAYFGFITLTYLALIFSRDIFSPSMLTIVVLFSVAAGIFSSYLLFIQAFVLKKWCIWCILTAMISLAVCVISLVSANVAVEFLAGIQDILLMVKYLGFCFGVGGTTASVFLFKRFLEDSSIDEKELQSIREVFELVWTGFVLVIVSQFAFFVIDPTMLATSVPAIGEMIALLVFAISAAILLIIYSPFLIYVPFHKVNKDHKKFAFLSLRNPTLTLGGIALVSWYFAFFMNFITDIAPSTLVAIFMVVLLSTALFVALWDKSLHAKEQKI